MAELPAPKISHTSTAEQVQLIWWLDISEMAVLNNLTIPTAPQKCDTAQKNQISQEHI